MRSGAKTKHHALWVLVAGAAVAMTVLVVAHFVSPAHVAAPLSLADLDRAHDTLMSCEEGESAESEPMWCADPRSPHCSPAAPTTPAPDLTDHTTPAMLLASARAMLSFALLSWPEPLHETVLTLADRARLERPPRV